MKACVIHSIVACLTAFTMPFVTACGSKDDPLPSDTTEGRLYLNIAVLEQTRGDVAQLPDNEKMKSVRVIVLHADGSIEHNRHYSLDGVQTEKYILLKVKPSEKKKLFLFANEESVTAAEGVATAGGDQSLTAFFDGFAAGMTGFEDAVNALYFAPDYSYGKPIPMSSAYEIEFPANGNFDGTFYVARVATKFTINFLNRRGDVVTVNKFSIASHADKNFLLAHVDDSEGNRQLLDGKSWIDWLKDVAFASSENDSYATTEAAGWLKDYRLPEQASNTLTYTHGTVTVALPTVDTENPGNTTPGKADVVPVFYLPESKSLKAGATDGEQEYTMTLDIAEAEHTFVEKLPNLKALFRNTHVVVNITLYSNLKIELDVIPYSSVTLDPIFGLDVPK